MSQSTVVGVSRFDFLGIKTTDIRTHHCKKIGPMQMEIGEWGFRVVVVGEQTDDDAPKQELIRVYRWRVQSSSVGVDGGRMAFRVKFDGGGAELRRVAFVVEFLPTKTESAEEVVKRVTGELGNFLTIADKDEYIRRQSQVAQPQVAQPQATQPHMTQSQVPQNVKAERPKNPKLTVRVPEVQHSPDTLEMLLRRDDYLLKTALKVMSDKKFPQRGEIISGHLEAVLMTKESDDKHPGKGNRAAKQ